MFKIFKSLFRKQETVSPAKNEIKINKSNKPLNEPLTTKVEQPFKRPSKKQLEESELLGITVNPNMSSREVWQLVEAAKKDPKTKKIRIYPPKEGGCDVNCHNHGGTCSLKGVCLWISISFAKFFQVMERVGSTWKKLFGPMVGSARTVDV